VAKFAYPSAAQITLYCLLIAFRLFRFERLTISGVAAGPFERTGRAAQREGGMRLGSVVMMAGIAIAPIAGPNAAKAAGFAIKQQSATAQGNAFAGATAGAESPSYMFFNPAALGRFDRSSVQLEANAIFTELQLRDAEAATTAGVPIAGTRRDGDVSDDAVLPAFYAVLAPEGDFRFGLGINVPFGLGTEYPTDWVGRYHTQKSNLLSININPSWPTMPPTG
jgi:long-subunit fatty acid transport protein